MGEFENISLTDDKMIMIHDSSSIWYLYRVSDLVVFIDLTCIVLCDTMTVFDICHNVHIDVRTKAVPISSFMRISSY